MSELFEVITAAIAARDGGPGSVAGALGMVFRSPADGANDVFEVAASQRSRSIDELTGGEMRIRRSTGRLKLLILQVDMRVRCVAEAEVVGRYGQPRDLIAPRPPQPHDDPTYSSYPQSWGELRIGIAHGCVASVVAEFRE